MNYQQQGYRGGYLSPDGHGNPDPSGHRGRARKTYRMKKKRSPLRFVLWAALFLAVVSADELGYFVEAKFCRYLVILFGNIFYSPCAVLLGCHGFYLVEFDFRYIARDPDEV